MYRMYHEPRKGKNKGKVVATAYWHVRQSAADAHRIWWTRVSLERWFYKEEDPDDGIILKDLGPYFCAYTSVSPTLVPVKETVVEG